MNVKIGVIKLTVFLIVVFIVGIPVLSVFLPSIEVLTIYPLLISLILSLLIFAYKMMKSEKSLEIILRVATAILILFWLFTQVATIITVELEYHSLVNEYSQLFKENPIDGFNSSWAVAVKYRNVFDGTYGKNEICPIGF